VLANHDVVREVTRYGDGELGRRRARAAALLMLALPGSAYVYQGEELGLEEVRDIPDALRQDPVFARTKGERPGRDGCRVPIPWSGDAPSFGFNDGTASWLPQPAHWAELTAELQSDDPTSMLALYREAIRLRHELDALGDGSLEWVEAPSGVLAFVRPDGFACVTNVSDATVAVPPGLPNAVLLASDLASTPAALAPDTTIWLSAH
jgi:alpha-glucosidase